MNPSNPPTGIFITGTDTDVGKTVITTGLINFFQASGIDCVGVKPICCGAMDDIESIQAANTSNGNPALPKHVVNPLYLEHPAAPKSITSKTPELDTVLKPIKSLDNELIIAEGAGGWVVPVSSAWNMEDLAVSLGYPVILVISNRLGALNHSVLTARAIQSTGLPLLGFFINTVEESEYTLAQSTNREVLKELLPCPCLGEIPKGGAEISSKSLCKVLKMRPQTDLPLQFYPPNF